MANDDNDELQSLDHDRVEEVSFSLRRYHIEQLRALSRRHGVSQSWLLRNALDMAFADWQSGPPDSKPKPPPGKQRT